MAVAEMKLKDLTLRTPTIDDAVDMRSLDELCFPEQVQYGKIEFLYLITRTDVISYVIEHQDKMLGFIMSSIEETKKSANIITLDVHPKYRRRGIATRLLTAVESQFTKLDLTEATLQVNVNNDPAVKFYRKKGYIIRSQIDEYYPGEDAYFMAKTLL
jgi:ribosomal-protein-alanine N-acetyltransferase